MAKQPELEGAPRGPRILQAEFSRLAATSIATPGYETGSKGMIE